MIQGAGAWRARRLIYLGVVSALGYPFGYLIAVLLHLAEPMRSLVGLALCAVAMLVMLCVASGLATIMAQTVAISLAPSAMLGSRRRTDGLSRIDTLVARGDIVCAIDLLERRIASGPRDFDVILRAAELYAGVGDDPTRAECLFRSVQCAIDAPARLRLYAANRLMDLYDGRLNMPGRVLVLLRWVITTFPGSSAARTARAALERRKAEQMLRSL